MPVGIKKSNRNFNKLILKYEINDDNLIYKPNYDFEYKINDHVNTNYKNILNRGLNKLKECTNNQDVDKLIEKISEEIFDEFFYKNKKNVKNTIIVNNLIERAINSKYLKLKENKITNSILEIENRNLNLEVQNLKEQIILENKKFRNYNNCYNSYFYNNSNKDIF